MAVASKGGRGKTNLRRKKRQGPAPTRSPQSILKRGRRRRFPFRAPPKEGDQRVTGRGEEKRAFCTATRKLYLAFSQRKKKKRNGGVRDGCTILLKKKKRKKNAKGGVRELGSGALKGPCRPAKKKGREGGASFVGAGLGGEKIGEKGGRS